LKQKDKEDSKPIFMKTVTVSKDFKRGATKAILSIIFFVFVYLLLILTAVALTAACGYAGIMLIAAKPAFFTLMIGAGLVGMGVLIIIFLIKFIFSKVSADNSHLIEISKADEPELFAFIEDVVKQVNTNFPKKVFISSEVNASVFYDSGFWSMFLPVRKNLHIGLGLMNAVIVNEFKGILAHEFGHFSQRSMKVGSYVHNVNHVLHNMLYDNSGYEKMVGRWAGLSNYFSLFVMGGVKMVSGMQWVLGRVYNVVNINYMALSREMEFHADEVAANVAGPQALATSLVRMDLASHSLSSVLNFYQDKIADNVKPSDIFAQHHYVMAFSANEYGLNFEHGLPVVTLETKSRFNKSKLTFEDQWSSHPSDNDRIKRLETLNIVVENTDTRPALSLFSDVDKIKEMVTGHLFSTVEYSGSTMSHAVHDFGIEYDQLRTKNSLSKKYNNFYDDLPLSEADFKNLPANDHQVTEGGLFSNDVVNHVYEVIGIEHDLKIVEQLVSGEIKLKSFDYDSKRYDYADAYQLIPILKELYTDKQLALKEYNNAIYSFYYNLAQKLGMAELYERKLAAYHNYNAEIEANIIILQDMYNLTSFVNQSNSFETIEVNMRRLSAKEPGFKKIVQEILNNPLHAALNNQQAEEVFTKYLALDKPYFINPVYNEEALGILFGSLNHYNTAIYNVLFSLKKDFLDFQASLTSIN
jgi:Zn-dependent protease with chaperone function